MTSHFNSPPRRTMAKTKPMTPKEKATELINKFSPLVTTWDCYHDTPRDPDCILKDAKECALICVDEIMQIFECLTKPEYTAFDFIGDRKFTFKSEYETHLTGYDMQEYFEEVKTAIKNL